MTMRACAAGVALVVCAGLAAAVVPGDAGPGASGSARGGLLGRAITSGLSAEAVAALKRNAPLPGMERTPAEFHRWLCESTACFKYPQTQAEWDEVVNVFQSRPPTLEPWFDPRLEFLSASSVWANDLILSTSQRAVPAHLTYSFPADGTTWGDDNGSFGSGPNVLGAALMNLFGPTNLDRGREVIRAAFANWQRNTGLKYDEVADDNTAYHTSSARFSTMGDIRIGGTPLSSSSVLAYNQFPQSGGDMVINTNSLNGGLLANTFSNYLYLRNVAAHEHGHGTGFIHTVPCNNTKLMEPFIFVNDVAPMMNPDDVRGGQRNYGDRFAGNNAVGNAVNFGDLTSPALRSVIEKDLSTNGASGFNSSSLDWFKFSLSSQQSVTITVTPTGTTANIGQQTSDCNGTTTSVNAQQAGNLELQLRDSAGSATPLAASNNAIGIAETVTMTLDPATYTIRVRQQGDGAAANLTVQTYDLLIRVGTSKAPPKAVAGVNKRCAANTNCWFLGSVNSRPKESGSSITGYAWDFDGDGTYDATSTNASFVYTSSGVYPVTLRVTDSNAQTDTDTINVTIFGGVTGVSAASPASGDEGTTVPITLSGNNFKTVAAASQVVVSGSGVAVMGTPVSNLLGTQLTGLSLQIAPGAAAGPRNITVTSSGSMGTGTGVFTVVGAPTCSLDYNLDGAVNPDDLGDFITDYYTAPPIPGPGGYAIPCPGNAAPYDQGYKAAFVPGGGQCNEPFPDNLGDFITAYFGGSC